MLSTITTGLNGVDSRLFKIAIYNGQNRLLKQLSKYLHYKDYSY